MKWQWFVGGKVMCWITFSLIILLILTFTVTYVIDPITITNMKVQKTDITAIKDCSEAYVKDLRYHN